MMDRNEAQGGPDHSTSNSSERTVRILIGLTVAVGVLFLGAMGAYTAMKAFNIGPFAGEEPVDYLSTESVLPAEKPTAGGATATQPMALFDETEPSPTETPTPDFQATSTAACKLFQEQFPGTPCPETPVPGLDATATAACEVFQSEFPETPCP